MTLTHVDFEEHSEGNSPVHRLDARIKIICATAAVFCIVVLSHWELALIFFATCIGLVLYSRASLKTYVKRLLFPLVIIAFVAVAPPFTYGTTVVAHVPGLMLPVFQEGILFAILLFTRCLAAVAVLNLLILITAITTVMDSLAWFHVPSVVIDTMTLMFRYISVLSEESTRMYRAQESRCGHSRSVSYIKKLANYGSIAGALLMRAFDRAIKVGDAMASRGYTGTYMLFTYEKRRLPTLDLIVGLLIVSASIALVIVDVFFL
jgi:cobalt/nickel transport system permease protein